MSVVAPAKRTPINTDWSHSCGVVKVNGKLVLPRSRKTFTATPLIREGTNDWETLREQVRKAEQEHPRSDNGEVHLERFVPMLINYRAQFEHRARQEFGDCIFSTPTKTRDWTLKNPGEVGRYVPAHGYFFRVLPKLVKYIQSEPDHVDLSWKGFKEWMQADLPGKKAESGHPPGTALAKNGKSLLRVAVACYVPPSADAEQRHAAEVAIASECEPVSAQAASLADDSEESDAGGEQAVVELEEQHSNDENDDEDDKDDLALPSRPEPHLAPSDDEADLDDDNEEAKPLSASARTNVHALKWKILREQANVQAEERALAVRKSNIAQWQDQLKDQLEAVDSRKRAREEEIEGMQAEMLVNRLGCEVDTSKEHRKVVAAYVKDLGTYADVDAVLTEHFTSAKRQQRTFTHQRGAQMLRGEGYGLGVQRFQAAQVRHDYFGHFDERKVAVVLEAKDECTYFNVGVAQMQLTRAEVSMKEFPNYTTFYHAAYATAPPCGDISKHNELGQTVYSPDMSAEAKERFFAPLKEALTERV